MSFLDQVKVYYDKKLIEQLTRGSFCCMCKYPIFFHRDSYNLYGDHPFCKNNLEYLEYLYDKKQIKSTV